MDWDRVVLRCDKRLHGFDGRVLVTKWADGTVELATKRDGQRVWSPPATVERYESNQPAAGGDFLLFEEADQ